MEAQDGSSQQPSGVFIPRTNLNEHQAKALLTAGIRCRGAAPIPNGDEPVKAPILTLERLVVLMNQHGKTRRASGRVAQRKRSTRKDWNIFNASGASSTTFFQMRNGNPSMNPAAQRLLALPFVVTAEDLSWR